MGFAVLHYFTTFTHQAIYRAHDVFFVTRNWVRAKYYHVAILDFDVTVRACRHAVKHRVQFTLATGGHNCHLAIRQFNNVFHLHDDIFWYVNSTGAQRNFKVLEHAIPRQCYLAVVLFGFVHNTLNTVNLRTKGANYQTALRVFIHHFTNALLDFWLAVRVRAFTFTVGTFVH